MTLRYFKISERQYYIMNCEVEIMREQGRDELMKPKLNISFAIESAEGIASEDCTKA